MAAIAKRFKVDDSSVKRWVKQQRTTGSLVPKPMGGKRHEYKVDAEGEKFIRETFEALPDTTLPELSEAYKEVFDMEVSPQTLSDTVRRMGYTKKRGSSARGQPNERMWWLPETPGKSSSPT